MKEPTVKESTTWPRFLVREPHPSNQGHWIRPADVEELANAMLGALRDVRALLWVVVFVNALTLLAVYFH